MLSACNWVNQTHLKQSWSFCICHVYILSCRIHSTCMCWNSVQLAYSACAAIQQPEVELRSNDSDVHVYTACNFACHGSFQLT